MLKQILILFFLIFLTTQFNISGKPPASCYGVYNQNPVLNFSETSRLEAEYIFGEAVGQKYIIDDYDGRQFTVLNLTGSSYEMGYLAGLLMRLELQQFLPNFFDWVQNFIQNNLTYFVGDQKIIKIYESLPPFAQTIIAKSGVAGIKAALDFTYEITYQYTPQRFQDEIKGMADGADVDIWQIRQVNMIAELLKASCSMMGAWGKSTYNEKLIQLRTLDWDAQASISQYPQVTIYHSTEDGSIPFANVGWPGFVGTLAGYSSYIGVCEAWRGVSDDKTTRFGKPWNYALRDTLQFSQNLEQAIQELNQTKRTCGISAGVGSSQANEFNIVYYAAEQFDIHDDSYSDVENSQSPHLDGILYLAYGPSQCFLDIIQENYGQITPEIVRQIASADQTGDSLVMVMDFARNYITVGYPNYETHEVGYNRPAVFIDLNPFLQTPTQYSK